jgi:hypothetical protein
MLKRVPIYPDINNVNNGGIHEYDPYIFVDNQLLIDKKWWNTLLLNTQTQIEKQFDSFELIDINFPHSADNNSQILKRLDQIYLDSFDYHIWYNNQLEDGPRNVKKIHINQDIKTALINRHYHRETNTDHILHLQTMIQDQIDIGQKYFMRLSTTSGKNAREIVPIESVNEIMDNLIKNEIFVKREYLRDKDTYLILIPWNNKIQKQNEFRFFVKNGKITGITQQWWNILFNYTQNDLDIFEKAFSNISFLNMIPYTDYIADIYVDMDLHICKLIEINPFGAHIGAGSGLFNWITDYAQLYDDSNGDSYSNEIEFRYQSIINY